MAAAANDLEKARELYRELRDQGETSVTVEALERVEQMALEQKAWPDLAAALITRLFLEYGLAHADAIYKERLVGYMAERVENAPVEVRSVLRLALAHYGLAMHYPKRWWKKIPKRPMDADDPPPWSAWRIVPRPHRPSEICDSPSPIFQKMVVTLGGFWYNGCQGT